MANLKITELDELMEAGDDDLFVVVDTSGTPTTKKIKASNMPGGAAGPIAVTMGLRYDIDGSTTPVAVALAPVDGGIYVAEADQTRKDDFIGFINTNATHATKATIRAEGDLNGTNPSGSVQMLAGPNKYILVLQFNAGASGNPAEPSSITWGATNLVKLANIADADRRIVTAWGAALGTLGSNTTNTLTVTGATAPSFNVGTAQWFDLENIDQSNPIAEAINSANAGSIANLTPNQAVNLVITGATSSNAASTPSDFTSVLSSTADGWNRYAAWGYVAGVGDFTIAWGGTLNQTDEEATAIVFKAAGNPTDVEVVVGGVLGGFSGLTPNAKYYLSNTAGAISTSPGSTSILLGKAISATEILIIQS